MNIFKKLAFKMAKSYIFGQLSKPEFKDSIIRAVNEKVNIPKLNESQERKLFSAVYDAIKEYLLIN